MTTWFYVVLEIQGFELPREVAPTQQVGRPSDVADGTAITGASAKDEFLIAELRADVPLEGAWK